MTDRDPARLSSIVTGAFGLDDYGRPVTPRAPAGGVALAEAAAAARAEQPVILFLTANPTNTDPIALPEELQDIRQRLRMTRHGRDFELEYEPAAYFRDLAYYLLEATPTIVHFSGHGVTEGIALMNEVGAAQLVSTVSLQRLFAQPTINAKLRLVVLNSCFSAWQAQAIVESVDCVVGMKASVPDSTARAFANGLYTALGSGTDVLSAFNIALAQISLEALPGEDLPLLLVREGVDPRTVQVLQEPDAGRPAGAAPAVAPARPAPTGRGLVKVGDRHWSWEGFLPGPIDSVFDSVEQAVRRAGARKVEIKSRTMLVARFGGIFGAFDATEEATITLTSVDDGTNIVIDCRSIQMQVSDFGRNEAIIRLIIGLLGVAER